MSSCSIDVCDRRATKRGWCDSHYARWLRHGNPQGGRRYMASASSLERLMSNVVVSDSGCWEWTGARHPLGYGNVNHPTFGYTGAHRAMWMELRGSIDPALELDHLCRNPPCVNPEHLEPVTHRTNVRRALRHELCQRGHNDWYHRKDRPGKRQCNECQRMRRRGDIVA